MSLIASFDELVRLDIAKEALLRRTKLGRGQSSSYGYFLKLFQLFDLCSVIARFKMRILASPFG